MHPHQESDTGYLSYMLRMWRKRDCNGKQMWCVSLEEPGSHHTQRFNDANAMFAFLRTKLGLEIEQPGEPRIED
jgi:hypothetical protein